MNVFALPSLHREARSIERRLETEHAGFGPAFTKELQHAIELVVSTPQLFSPSEDGPNDAEFREYFIARFNYRLIYAIDGNDLIFVALAHAHQLPGKWTRRWNEDRERFLNEG